jgi:phosphatidylglycerol:prolipoprotein diacylglycerol transferase
VCELPWPLAVQFPAGSPPYIRQAERGQLYGIQVSAQVDAASSGAQAVISSVTPNSEAAKQGVQVGDRIKTINEQPITSAQEAWQAIFEAFRRGESIDLETSRGQAILLAPLPGSRDYSLPVHPTQLYSVLDALLIAWFLLAFEPFRRRDGEATAITCTLYPITRFVIEIIRTDEAAVFGTGMSISQNISLAILVYATLLWMRLLRSPPKIAWPIGAAPAVTESKRPINREVRVAGASTGRARPVDRPAKR